MLREAFHQTHGGCGMDSTLACQIIQSTLQITTWILGLGIHLYDLHEFQQKQVAKPTTN